MIYINDELQKSKPEKLFREFQAEFGNFLDVHKRERLIKPVTIKYIPSMIKADPKNKGKFIQPRSIDIRHVSQIQIGDTMADVRYTKTAPLKDPQGVLKYKEISTSVVGRIATTDIDFLFFFWAYSNQNVANEPNAKLLIENKEREIELEAIAKRNEAKIQSMLWNEEKFGGIAIGKLVDYARTVNTISNPDEMSADAVRNAISRSFTIDRMGKSKFLDFMYVESKTYEEVKPMLDAVAKAIEANVISQVNAKQTFYFNDSEGKPDKLIWCWKDSVGTEKPPVKLYQWLEKFEPATLEKLIDLTNKRLEVIQA